MHDALKVSTNPLNEGTGIVAAFIPNYHAITTGGEPLTLSEAEVVFGVDHFNWLQTVQAPENIFIQTWRGHPEFHPDGSLVTEIGPDDMPKPVGLQLVDRNPSPVYDPVVNSGGDKVYVARTEMRDRTVFYLVSDWFVWDAYPPYLQEVNGDFYWGVRSKVGGPETPSHFIFEDMPSFPVPAAFLTPDAAFKMTTTLVGMTADHRVVPLPEGIGVRGFTWEWNSYTSGNVAYFSGRPDDAPPIKGGGIFNVRHDDGTPVPGFPTDPPPLNIPVNAPPLPPPTAPVTVPLTALLMRKKSGKTQRLVIRLSRGGVVREILSPFQKPQFSAIQVVAQDTDGDGADDTAVVTASKGKKKMKRTFTI
jgi:hypothetical protein